MEQAIQKAVEGGWNKDWKIRGMWVLDASGRPDFLISKGDTLLDPLFWQALGKAEGWVGTKYLCDDCHLGVVGKCTMQTSKWRYQWHRFIDHLASGKSPDSFFEELLTPNQSKR